MNFRRDAFVFVFVSLAAIAFGADLRDYVCVVRPAYGAATQQFYTNLGDSLIGAGYKGLGESVRAGGARTFGTGFVVKAPDGKDYVLTNRHVVLDAETAMLEFETPGGQRRGLAFCPIVAVDEEADLALIALEEDHPGIGGLRFAQGTVSDGQDVWAAGYPGLIDSPSWQLGRGTVTNASARVPLLMDPAVSTLIQHSAPADPGNSGGPLLVAKQSAPGGYEVVGITTWKANFRQAANFSTPSKIAQEFIARSVSRAEPVGNATLKARMERFALVSVPEVGEDTEKRIEGLKGFLSLEYVTQYGVSAVMELLKSAPGGTKSLLFETFSSLGVTEGARLACAWQIHASLYSKAGPESLSSPSLIESAGLGTLTDVSYTVSGGGVLSTQWVRELGVWRVRSSTVTASAKTYSAGKSKALKVATPETPADAYSFAMLGEYTLGGGTPMYGASFYTYESLLGTGAYFHTGESSAPETFDSMGRAFEIGGLGRFQYGFDSPLGMMYSYIEGRVGLHLDPDGLEEANGLAFSAGCGFQLCWGSSVKFLVNPGAQVRFTSSGDALLTAILSAGIGF